MIYDDVIKIVSNFQRNTGMDIHKKPIEVDESLVLAIGKHLKLKKTKVSIYDVRTSSEIIYGSFRRFKDQIDIGVKESLNTCWTRFVTCKELCHILMSNNGDGITGDPKILINGLYESMLFGKKSGNEDLDHEHMAMLCAAEILMPYEASQELLKKDEKEIPSPLIAQTFKVPLYMAQVYRNKEVLDERERIYSSL